MFIIIKCGNAPQSLQKQEFNHYVIVGGCVGGV